MTIDEFLYRLDFKPKIVYENIEGVIVVDFEESDNKTPSIEFGVKPNDDGQYFYFEILDMKDYKEGDFISIDSSRRHNVISTRLNSDNAKSIINFVNESLRNLYG